jgi:hypothetical protein
MPRVKTRQDIVERFTAAVRGLAGRTLVDEPPSMRLSDTRYTLDASDLGDAWNACGFPPGGSIRCRVAALGGRSKGALMNAPSGAARDPAEGRRAAALARWVGVPWAIVKDGDTWRLLDTTALDEHGVPVVAAEVDLAAERKALEDSANRYASDDAPLVGFSKRTRAKLKRHLLPAWTPVVTAEPAAGASSHFGGSPWLPLNAARPNCGRCGNSMTLFLQLDLSTLPAGAPRAGPKRLLQFYFCTSTEPQCWDVDSPRRSVADATNAWLVQTLDATVTGETAVQDGDLTAKPIVGWKRLVEFPDGLDLDEIGLEVESDEEGDLLCESEIPLGGSKLGGWPSWIHRTEWIDCPDCGVRMRQVFQLTSGDHVDRVFGCREFGKLSVGRDGHVFQCPTHPERFGFSWERMDC